MQSVQFVSVLIIIVATIFTCDSTFEMRRHCLEGGCAEQCANCEYGAVWNPDCGFWECGLGPDVPCIERPDSHNCGAGLICQCQKCHGCSSKALKCSHSSSTNCSPRSQLLRFRGPNFRQYDSPLINNLEEI